MATTVRPHAAPILAALTLLLLAAAPAGAQMARATGNARRLEELARRLPTDSLARLVSLALDAPRERDQELFDAITCQLYRLDHRFGVELTERAAARVADSVLATPELRERFAAVQARWPSRSTGWDRCVVDDLGADPDDLVIEGPPPRAPAKKSAPARAARPSPRR